MRLEFSTGADADLEEIWDYSARNWGSARAVEYLDRIADCAEALARGELSGTAEDHLRPGLRRQVVQLISKSQPFDSPQFQKASRTGRR